MPRSFPPFLSCRRPAHPLGYVPEYPWNVSCANVLVQEDFFVVNGTREWSYPIDVCNDSANQLHPSILDHRLLLGQRGRRRRPSLTGQADDFELTSGCGSTLAAKSSCILSLVFKPVSAGGKSASIGIADTASGSPQPVTLSGMGG